MAKKIGTKQPVISRLETGAEKPSVALLGLIAKALNVNLLPSTRQSSLLLMFYGWP